MLFQVEVWRTKNQSVSLCLGSSPLCFYKDFCKKNSSEKNAVQLLLLQADLYAGALFITKSTGYEGDGPIYFSILILLAIACLFTVAGGLTAVIWTDFIQTILMIIGAVVLAILGTAG